MKSIKKIVLILLVSVLLLSSANIVCADETQALTSETGTGVHINATTEVRNTPSFSVNIPQTIPMGSLQRAATEGAYSEAAFQVSLSENKAPVGKEILVKISTADGFFKLYNGVYALPYEVKVGDAVLKSGDTFASFTAEKCDAVSGRIVIDRYDIAAEGTYTGVLIFTVSVQEAMQ